MPVGKPMGGAAFVSVPTLTTEQTYAHCRPRGGERADLRGTVAPTEAQVMAAANFQAHSTARSAAERRGKVAVITNEQLLLTRTANAQPHHGALDLEAILAQLEDMQAEWRAAQAVTAGQAVTIDKQTARIAALEAQTGNDAFLAPDQS